MIFFIRLEHFDEDEEGMSIDDIPDERFIELSYISYETANDMCKAFNNQDIDTGNDYCRIIYTGRLKLN